MRKFFGILSVFILGSIDGFSQPSIYINEFLASNVSTNADLVDFGDFSDWIELYNDEEYPADLGGYFITDNLADPTKWQIPENTIIPAKGFLLLWADDFDDTPGNEYIRDWWPDNISFTTRYFHTNFKLDKDSEEIALFNSQEILIDAFQFSDQIEDVSYGRKPDGSSTWYYFGEPTPKTSNSTEGVIEPIFSKDVLFSIPGGFYSGSISVELTSTSGNGFIRYTLDGTEPTSGSTVYTSPILVTDNTTIAARVFEEDKLPGKLYANTYLFDSDRKLPAFSISADYNLLMAPETGIYRNTLKEREIPVNLEYFPLKGNSFSMRTGMRIGGENIYRFAQKPLNIYARGDYGESEIEYPVFDHLPFQAYKRLYLRNSGDDWPNTMIRDGMIASLLRGQVSNSTKAYRPTVLYLNGEYWGIYNLREKLDKQYFSLHFGTAEIDLDHLESNAGVIEGDNSEYLELLNFVRSNDLADQSNYDYVADRVDIHNLMDFVIVQSYLANSSWGHNREMWRDRGNENLWRWVLVDMDRGFNINRISSNQIDDIYADFELFQSLINNEGFKYEFVQRFSERLNTTFSTERVIEVIDSLQAQIAPEMPRHIEKWGTYIDSLSIDHWGQSRGVSSMSYWNSEVEEFRTFAAERPAHVVEHLADQFDLQSQAELSVTSNIGNNGKVSLNGFFKNAGFRGNYFKGIPIRLKAYAPPGYRFKSWVIAKSNEEPQFLSDKDEIEFTLEEDSELQIEFEEIAANFIPSIVNSNTILNASNSPYLVNENIRITPGSTLSVEPGVQIKLNSNTGIFVEGGIQLIGSENEPITLTPYYPEQQWSGIFLDNATNSSTLEFVEVHRATGIENDANFFSAISALNSKIHLNHVHIDNVRLPVSSQFSDLIIENSIISNVTLIGDYLNVNGGNLWVLNNIFEGNNIEDMDAIDIGFMEDTTVIHGNIFRDFVGDNTDAVDVGDASTGVQITHNKMINCGDKAVSIGQGSDAFVAFNVVANCNLGVGIKDAGSFGEIVNNTFYHTSVGVAVYEKVLNRGGGSAVVKNSLFLDSQEAPVTSDEFSIIEVSYSLSDTEPIDGSENLNENPELINPQQLNFYPQVGALILNTGDPDSPVNTDGSRAHIGALSLRGEKKSGIVINEINYNSSETFNPEDWVEFYNHSGSSIDLSGWVFTDASKEQTFVFQEKAILPGNSFYVIARDRTLFTSLFPDINPASTEMTTGLSGSGESLYLYDDEGYLVDSLTFTDSSPWPFLADGNGSTLELIYPGSDNGLPDSWAASEQNGTPGVENSQFVVSSEPLMDAIPTEIQLHQNYPNPFNPNTIISFELPEASKVQLQIFDMLGREVAVLVDGLAKPGYHQIIFEAPNLASGMYIYLLRTGNEIITRKMMLIK